MKKPEDTMRVLKTATCKSITGKSTLTYQIGALPDSTVHIRITKNTGAGFFNDEWIKIDDIRKALDKAPNGQPLTSFLIASLYKGKSVNSPAFMFAALTNERLLRVLKGKKRGHEFLDPEDFDAKMDKLVSSKGTTGRTAKKTVRKAPRKTAKTTTKKAAVRKTSTKNAAVKKRSVSRRKKTV